MNSINRFHVNLEENPCWKYEKIRSFINWTRHDAQQHLPIETWENLRACLTKISLDWREHLETVWLKESREREKIFSNKRQNDQLTVSVSTPKHCEWYEIWIGEKSEISFSSIFSAIRHDELLLRFLISCVDDAGEHKQI